MTRASLSPAAGSLDSDARQVSELTAITRSTLSAYTKRDVGSHSQYWSSTTGFVVGNPGIPCWYCYDTPATAAAVLSTGFRGSAALRAIAVDTWSVAIRSHLRPSGEITQGNGSNGVGTGFFAVQLGLTYLVLHQQLSERTRMIWKHAMVRMANFLIGSGALDYYINGNVNLRQAEVMWLTWAITRHRAYLNHARSELEFVLHPPTPRWTGYGLRLLHGTSIKDRLARGYLTESDGSMSGFDPSYTLTQMDTATQMFVLTRDWEYLELANLEFNELRPLVSRAYILNAHGGTRHSDIVPFLSATPLVLLASGERPSLRSYWIDQIPVIRQQYLQAQTFANTGFYNGVANWLATALLAVRYPHGILSASCSPQRSPVCRAAG
jgi:hypothetical protein